MFAERMRLSKKISIVILILLFSAICFGLYLYQGPACKNQNAEFVYVNKSDNSDTLAQKLSSQFGLTFPFVFHLLAEQMHLNKWIKEGRYTLKPGMTLIEVINLFREGKRKTTNLVIRPMLSLENLAGIMGRKLEADSIDFIRMMNDSVYLNSLGLSKEIVFAHILPDTYNVYWHITPEEWLIKIELEYDKYWNKERLEKANALQMHPYDLIILASIVCKETNKNDEMPMVAGMYLNRLRIGMPLQADPTIKFALNEPGLRRILKIHLSVQSPYNTYLNKGLPPGPICIASKQSIDAVLNASQHAYLYMCAKEDFSGYHNFAKDYASHLKNAKRYQEALNKKGITE